MDFEPTDEQQLTRETAQALAGGEIVQRARHSEREQLGRPITGVRLVQAMLAEMRVRTDAAQLVVWRAASLRDQGRPCTTETSIVKLHATEAAVWCANEAIPDGRPHDRRPPRV